MTELSPIVLFVYNRPDHTLQTLDAFSKADLADESVLYIYADGPKVGARSVDLQAIKDVRSVIRQRKWCKEVHIVESEKNKGLADSITSGVTDVVNRHGRVIVLEDDIVVSKGFLKYCNEALEAYQDDDEVMHVSGCMYGAEFKTEKDTFFLKVLSCHGWATWKRAWNHYNHDVLDHLAYFQSDPQRCHSFDIEGNAYFMKQLQHNVTGELKSWAVRWYASWLRAGGLTLFPKSSLVNNIGFDGTGENIGQAKSYLAPAVDYIRVEKQKIEESDAIRHTVGQFWGKYLKKPDPPELPLWWRLISCVLQPVWPIGTRLTRRILIKLFPELKPLLLAQGKLNWNGVVSSVSRSFVDETAKIFDPSRVSNSRIGAHTYVAHNAYISYAEIGKFCSIGPNFSCGWGVHPVDGISTSPSFYSSNPANNFSLCEESKVIERKKITIGNDVFVGMKVTVLDGVSIGDGAVIGAGCVVSKDVPPYAIVVGSPMKVLRYRFDEDVRERLRNIEWWNWPQDKLHELERHFFKVEEFIHKSVL